MRCQWPAEDERLSPSAGAPCCGELTLGAWSPEGLVEAVESRDHGWVVGVQWHPERLEMRPDADALFAAFVDACRK